VALVLLLGVASAQAAPKDDAAKVFARGKKLFAEKDYLGALEAFGQAYRLKPHYLMQCNIARCHERLADFIKAARHYKQCLEEGASKDRSAAKVRAALQKSDARITWLEVRSPGKGGTVHLNGVSVGPAPQRVPLNPGEHALEVRRPNATAASTRITTTGGETRTVELVPQDLASAPPPPATSVALPPPPPPPPRPRRRGVHQAWFWTTAAIAVGSAVAAGVIGYQALSAKNDYEANPTRDGYNLAKDRRLVANIFWGATAAAGITTGVLFFFTDFRRGKGKEQDDLALGLGYRGSF
jgi:tetratricopeptide (TPR) repeat protein